MKFEQKSINAYKERLKDLLKVSSPSGKERVMANHIAEIAGPLAESVQFDNYGNLMVKVGGKGKKLMLSAHIDELGYWIKSISPEGFLHAYVTPFALSSAFSRHAISSI